MFRNSKLLFWTCEILLLTVIFYIWKSMGTLISPFVSVLNTILLPFLIAGFLYYITNPIVELLEKDVEILERILAEITDIKHQEVPPVSSNSKLCKKCAYYDLCFI